MNITVLGLGYVGSVTGACLAELGHHVIGVDRDEFKVSSIQEGKAPFHEPELDGMIARHSASGQLRATTKLADAIPEADIAIICVGTPSERNGNLGLGQLKRVCEEIAATLPARTKPLIVAIRSTVFPGTCREVVQPALGNAPLVKIVANPEFLREGTAVRDFMRPELVVVGGDDRHAMETVASLYATLQANIALVSLGTAEMIKYACNAFHAVKISFANEVGAICGKLGIPAAEVMSTLCLDTRLNISAAYLKPGFAFGGSCLPKDLRALNHRTSHLDLNLPMLDSILDSNHRHLMRSVQAVLELPPAKTGVFGLAFKENTDDLRESPVVSLLESLIGKGVALRVYDPHIRIEALYGSNRNYVLESIPHIGRLMAASLEEVLDWADRIVIAQKPSPEMAERIQASGLPVVDLVGAFTPTPNAVVAGSPAASRA